MASTVEVFLAGLALVINTVIIIILYFVCNAFLGPFVHAMENVVTGANQVIPIGPFTWIFGFVFSLLLIFEIILVIAFIAVVGRRTVYDEYV
jgi:hypothetical protein